MAGKITLYDAIDSHIKRFRDNLYTALPAVVEKYNSDKQTVDVTPTLNMTTNKGQELPWATLRDVQVMFPSAGGGLLSFPVKKGDTVLLVFSKNSLDAWKNGSGNPVKLNSKRSHSASDAIAIVGLYTTQTNLSPNPDDVELKFNDNSIILKEDGNIEIKTNSTIKIQNNSTELIGLLSNLIEEITNITTNTIYGPTPINNIAALQSIKDELDTLRG